MSHYFEVRDVAVSYSHVNALHGVSLAMNQGEIIALIGANGAGKTSLLRAITGLTKVRQGEIWLGENRIDCRSPEKIVSYGISMVPEGRRIFPFMSVFDNLLMGAYQRRDRQSICDDLERIYTRFPRLKERLRQQAGSLSGGEQQMLAIGRALMARPQLLLLDEPSLGLAPIVVREIAKVILSINREDGVSIILVEQNSRMALKVSSYAYVLETGTIALSGASDDLLRSDYVRQLYLGVMENSSVNPSVNPIVQ